MKRIIYAILTMLLVLSCVGCIDKVEHKDKYDLLFTNTTHGARKYVFSYSVHNKNLMDMYSTKLDKSIDLDSDKEEMLNLFYKFYLEYLYLEEQYVIIHAYFNMFPTNEDIKVDFKLVKDEYITNNSKYINYVASLLTSTHKDYFLEKLFTNFTEEDINNFINTAASRDDTYVELNLEVAELELEFNELLMATIKDYDELALVLIDKINTENELADHLGYDNYVEYAYDKVYSREFSYNDLEDTIQSAKDNITPSIDLFLEYIKNNPLSTLEKISFNRLDNGSYFSNEKELEDLANFMKGSYLDNYNYFWNHGEYYFGNNSSKGAAYIQTPSTRNFTMAYFGPGYYSGLSTVTHEIGHYMAALEDKKAKASDNIDLCEFQAQANELLLATFMMQTKESNVNKMYGYNKVANSLLTILQSFMVSEFEYTVYTTSNLTSSFIRNTMSDIISSYNANQYISDIDYFWAGTSTYSTGYYIAYGISVIPSIELFFEDIEDAKNDYIQIMKANNHLLPIVSTLEYQNPLNYSAIENITNKLNALLV